MKKHILVQGFSGRTRFGEIVAEFWAPKRPSQKAIILCDGCPSLPTKRKLAEFLARKGYWVFHIRYRGTWESEGEFLKASPHEDVLFVAGKLRSGEFLDITTRTKYFLDLNDISVIGVSFGGAAAILASIDDGIDRAIAIAPVIDWTAPSKEEPFEYFQQLIFEGFGGAYRTTRRLMDKLRTGRFYQPRLVVQKVSPEKLFVIHAKDDEVVPVAPLRDFARRAKIAPLYLPEGGHLSSRVIMERLVWKEVKEFLGTIRIEG